MSDIIHLRIKKGYAAALIEDLIRIDAVEAVEEYSTELTTAQKSAIDQELLAMEADPGYLLKWDDIRSKYNKP